MEAAEVRRCAFFVKKRGRCCRMAAAKGSSYCGEHLIHDKTDTLRKRVPCPLDCSHSVFEDQLPKHLKKCNAGKRSQPACFKEGVNSNQDAVGTDISPPLQLSDYPEAKLAELIERVNEVYLAQSTGENAVEEEVLCHASLESDLCDPNNGPVACKHLKQQSSILGHMNSMGLLLSTHTAYIEFGSGRGKLSEKIHQALSSPDNVHFMLVDKSSCRRKVDGSLRTSALVGVAYHRLLMDIRDLDLMAVELVDSVEHVVGVSKHLCGAATDLTLRCLVNSHSPKLQGCLIALCCHHRVTWAELAGRDYLATLGFSSADFHMISHMTSWAVCGVRPDKSESRLGYVPHKNEAIGLKCKRLIDFARLSYLRSNGLRSRLVTYVDKKTSLENVLLKIQR